MTPPRWTLIYDGDCAFCSLWVRRLGRWDRHGRLTMVPSQDRAARATLPPLTDAALAEAMHLVAPDGSVSAGAAALPRILALVPWGRPLAALFALPFVPAVADRVYRWVARNRHKLPGATAACEVDR